MFTRKFLHGALMSVMMIVLVSSCRQRDALLPDNLVVFETATQGMAAVDNSIVIKLKFSAAAGADVPVALNLTEQGAVYGTKYSTTPAAVAGKLTLSIPAGATETSFTVSRVAGALFDGDEKLQFTIAAAGSPVLIGLTKQLTLSFSELVASTATATIDGGGALFPNKVFIDLSANRQTAVPRSNWDLGFYTGTDDYRVLLNSSSAMMAKQLNKNDLTTVTAADTIGFSTDVVFSQTAPSVTSLPYIDYPNGDITRTAIAAVAAVATDNKVYIVNRGTGIGTPAPARGWKKIRILRNTTGGYTLQYADIAATSFTSLDIAKTDLSFFNYISFDNGAVPVEPAKKKWDIAWTYFSNVTNFGAGEVPYLFQDVIILNRNVQVAKVLTATKAFDAFAEADLATQTFMTAQNAIAADWRSGGGPTTAPAVRTDRYYIIKDGDNNYYKLRFTALTQNGERGYPAFETVLVKKG